jgi:hypothetical protein
MRHQDSEARGSAISLVMRSGDAFDDVVGSLAQSED